ncbi:hypothetical protein AX774_g2234 [Zancudomyces culisetae]|uniref:Uncharacterized protein n=1 Tax=Zancudomyces culisetae TaxID=1213189 RepID=A0A1R1PTG1_ZANCU|nr:hypothetical protein AX774_g2234 [Zancudomyces culisetae]|eukprot:OMH84237.1 hypothetical protein AX774_g2234 [Zancudomyces culisetae]
MFSLKGRAVSQILKSSAGLSRLGYATQPGAKNTHLDVGGAYSPEATSREFFERDIQELLRNEDGEAPWNKKQYDVSPSPRSVQDVLKVVKDPKGFKIEH